MAELREITVADEREPLIVYYDIELDDALLDPYGFRVYQRIARRCAGAKKGKCNESLDAMAQACRMSRAQLTRSLRILIQRRMIRRESKSGFTSYYVLLDKRNWLSFEEWEKTYHAPKGEVATVEPPSKETTRLYSSREVATIEPGVATIEPGGGSTVATKKTREENKRREESRERAAGKAETLSGAVCPTDRGSLSNRPAKAVCSTDQREMPSPLAQLAKTTVVPFPASTDNLSHPADNFSTNPSQREWSLGERFILKASELWDEINDCAKPTVEMNWKCSEAVKQAGRYVMSRLNIKAKVGGTPKLFLEFWRNEMHRTIQPRPEYIVEHWEAYDRWLIENYETHRQERAA